MIELFVPLAVLAGGLAAGGLMISALGGAPLLLSLPPDRYLPVHKFLVTRFDPFMPICLLTALVGDLLIVVFAPAATSRALAGAGAVIYAAVVYISLTKNVPINKWIGTLDAIPEGWERIDPRERWKNWNLARTTLAVLALVCNVVVVGSLI